MTHRRFLITLLIFPLGPTAWAQTYSLAEAPPPGACFRCELKMNFAGEFKFRQDGKDLTVKQTAEASHTYVERVLDVSKLGLIDRAARHYFSAQGLLGADKAAARTLRPARALMVAQRQSDKLVAF